MTAEPEQAEEPVEEAPAETPGGGSNRSIALLLTFAAVVGVTLGGRASLISSDAGDGWQSALRLEVKRAAAAVEDVRFVYESEGPIAFDVRQIRTRAAALRRLATASDPDVRSQLLLEARAQDLYAKNLASGIAKELTGPRYLTPQGGFDAAKRLADQRAKTPDLRDIDPTEAQEAGDRASRKSIVMMAATIPAALGFLLGAFGEAFPRPRRWFVLAGGLCVLGAAVVGLIAEVAVGG
jgi:hypothetical protein